MNGDYKELVAFLRDTLQRYASGEKGLRELSFAREPVITKVEESLEALEFDALAKVVELISETLDVRRCGADARSRKFDLTKEELLAAERDETLKPLPQEQKRDFDAIIETYDSIIDQSQHLERALLETVVLVVEGKTQEVAGKEQALRAMNAAYGKRWQKVARLEERIDGEAIAGNQEEMEITFGAEGGIDALPGSATVNIPAPLGPGRRIIKGPGWQERVQGPDTKNRSGEDRGPTPS